MAKIDIDKLVAWLCANAKENDMNAFREISEFLESQGLQYNMETKEIESVEPDFKIEAGKYYICIKPCIDYAVGRVYKSLTDGFICGNQSGASYNCIPFLNCFRLATPEEILPSEQKLVEGVTNEPMEISPKFKEGDWLSYMNTPVQITRVLEDGYECFAGNGYIHLDFESDMYHLWTIQDAKEGDILFQDLMGGKTFIYNGINPDMAILYSFIISNDDKDILPYHIGKPNTGIGNIEESKNFIYPATKEQRDLLFQKMKEAGYEWDSDRKKLKKIKVRKFKSGDTIEFKGYGHTRYTILEVHSDHYISDKGRMEDSYTDANFELVEPKQDTAEAEEELTEFEAALLSYLFNDSLCTDNDKAEIKKKAKSLLRLSRKQFIDEACKFLEEWDKYRVCVEGQKDWFVEQFRKEMGG